MFIGKNLLDWIGLGTGENVDPYLAKLNTQCLNGDFAECFKSRALQTLDDFFDQVRIYYFTPYFQRHCLMQNFKAFAAWSIAETVIVLYWKTSTAKSCPTAFRINRTETCSRCSLLTIQSETEANYSKPSASRKYLKQFPQLPHSPSGKDFLISIRTVLLKQ